MTFPRSILANSYLRYGVTLLLLALIVWKIQPQHLVGAASSIRPANLIFAMLLTVPFLCCKIARWYLMLRSARIEVSPTEAAVSLIGGMGVALMTPARVGEVVRVGYIRDPRKWTIGGLVMIDKGLDVLVLAVLSVPGAWLLVGPAAGISFTVLSLAGLGMVYRADALSRLLHRVSARLPGRRKLEAVWASLETLSPPATTMFLALTLVSFLIVLLQFAIILLSWRAWSLAVVLFTFPLVILTNILPITIGGLGVREGAAAILLSHYGVSRADAVLAAFLMFALNTALPGIIGAFSLPLLGRTAPRASDSP